MNAGLEVSGAHVLVLGLGVTGRAVAAVLAANGAHVLASSADADVADVARLRESGIDVETGGHERAAQQLSTIDFVVPSPGISPHRGFLAELIARDLRVVSELDLAASVVRAPLVAVTGTNGKTTVCMLAEQIGRAAGLKAFACGNTETPFITAAAEHPDADMFIVEASSFGLYFCETLHPRAGVITNLTPDHLDWHPSLEDYRGAKARMSARQTAGDLFLYPWAQPELTSLATRGPQLLAFADAPFGARDGAWTNGDEVVVRMGERAVRAKGVGALAQRGRHFGAAAAAASGVLVFLGATDDAIEQGLRSFEFARHRLEPVGSLGGVRVIDDSVSTNPHATIAALRSFGADRVVLIAGGRNKGLDLTPLASEAGRLKGVVALGEAADDIAAVFAESGVTVRSVGSMSEAVSVALEWAEPPEVVLLSPACASHDMFRNYADRGRAFREACRSLGVAS